MKMGNFSNPTFFQSWSKIYNDKQELAPQLAYKTMIVHEYILSQNKKFLELRQAILDKHGERDEKGKIIITDGNIKFKNDSLEDVSKEFLEVQNIDLDPASPVRLKLEDLEKNGIKLTGPDISILRDLLDLGEEKAPLALVPPPSN